MKLSELIQRAEQLKAENGDIEVLDEDYYSTLAIKVRTFEEDCDFYNAKKGDMVAVIRSGR